MRFRFGSQVLDSGLGLRFGIQVWYSNFKSCLGFRFGIQVWDSRLGLRFGIQVLYPDWDFRDKIQIRD